MTASWKPSSRTSGRFLSPRIVDETGSTNADLVDRARKGAPSGEVLIARHQTAGRGRQGRTWFDRPGTSLLLSWSTDIEPTLAPLVPLVVGTAVSEAIDRLVGTSVTALKWPNDVLVPSRDERKLTGILAEAVTGIATGQSEERLRVVVGMGTNLDLGLGRRDVPPDVAARAIDLASLTDEPVDPPAVVDVILDSCDAQLTQLEVSPAGALETYRSRCLTIGRSVRFQTGRGVIEGTVRDVADDGALVLEAVDGTVQHLTAGDAHHVG